MRNDVQKLGVLLFLSALCGAGCGGVPTSGDGGSDASQTDTAMNMDSESMLGADVGGLPSCSGPCCPPAIPGQRCSAPAGAMCPNTDTCPGGLLLSGTLGCVGGVWTATSPTCPPADGTAANGCPGSQPMPSSPCTLPEGMHCQYALVCPVRNCDAGAPPDGSNVGVGCSAPAGRVGPAFCRGGRWDTTPLGTCP